MGSPKMVGSWWRGLIECGPLQWQTTSVFLPWEPHEQYEKAKRTLKDELPRSVGAQYATGERCRNNSRKNEAVESKQKQHPVVGVTGNRSNVRWCKEQYCMGTWIFRSMNQGKFKQEMGRVNVDILGISERRMEWVNLTQMTIISTTVGRNPLEEME